MFVPIFKIIRQVVPEKSLKEILLERKKNGQIKGLIDNMWLFFVTQYNTSRLHFVPNVRILSQVVAEKSLTEKMFTDKQTNIVTEKAKTTLYKLRTVGGGGGGWGGGITSSVDSID